MKLEIETQKTKIKKNLIIYTNNCCLMRESGKKLENLEFFLGLMDSKNRKISILDDEFQHEKNVVFSVLANKRSFKQNFQYLVRSQELWNSINYNKELDLKQKNQKLLQKIQFLQNDKACLCKKNQKINKILASIKNRCSLASFSRKIRRLAEIENAK